MSIDNMPMQSSVVEISVIKGLEPLGALSPESLGRLAALASEHRFNRGDDVLAAPFWDGRVVYLLSGELTLVFSDGLVLVVVGGSGRALHPVWIGGRHGHPADRSEGLAAGVHLVSASAITDCVLLSLDEQAIDLVVTWDQLAEGKNAVGQSDFAAVAVDWRNLTGLCSDQSLVKSAFATIPSANIPRLMESFNRMSVRRGDEIIRQGEQGDYYYLIERGRCKVTREIGGVITEVADLRDGDGFGEEALVSAATRNATVSMKTDGVLWRLAKSDFATLLQEPLLRKIRAEALKKSSDGEFVWIDVRFPVEFRQNGIPGAVNIPLNEIRNATGVLDPKKKYLVYCQTGRRSSAAAFLLSQRGIQANLLDGGLNAMDLLMESAA